MGTTGLEPIIRIAHAHRFNSYASKFDLLCAVFQSDVFTDPHRVRFETTGTDSSSAADTLYRFYAGTDWSVTETAQPFAFRYSALGDEAMTLRSSSMTGALSGDIPPGSDYIVQWVVDGRGAVDVRRDDVRLQHHVPMLCPPHRSFVFRFEDYDQKIVQLGRRHVARIAEERGLRDVASARFDHLHRPGEAEIIGWRSVVSDVASAVRTGRITPLLWDGLCRRVAHAFLDLYPPVGSIMPAALIGSHRPQVAAAVEFIHDNIHEPIGPVEIAAAAHLSVRGLQAGFRRHLDTTPLAYVRDTRLDRVRIELRVGDPALVSVGGVARQWGFSHLGRFSAVYAARFGELPSETLRS